MENNEVSLLEKTDRRILFSNHIKSNGISTKWVAMQIDLNFSHLYKILKSQRPLTEKNKAKLNELFNTDF